MTTTQTNPDRIPYYGGRYFLNGEGLWADAHDDGRVLSFDECEALGLDGTGRGA